MEIFVLMYLHFPKLNFISNKYGIWICNCLVSSYSTNLVDRMYCLEGGGGVTPSYILHTRAFRAYLTGGYLSCRKDYKILYFQIMLHLVF